MSQRLLIAYLDLKFQSKRCFCNDKYLLLMNQIESYVKFNIASLS